MSDDEVRAAAQDVPATSSPEVSDRAASVPPGNGVPAQAANHVGRALRRKEDPRLITGRARYVDDITLPGTVWAALVRSPEAHARIVSIDSSAAREAPGVVAVFTGEDLSDLESPLPMAWAPPGVEVNNPPHWPLARGKVRHVGDPVAVVLGADRYSVIDAAEQVVVEYDPLPAMIDPEAALEEGATLLHDELGTNRIHEWTLEGGDPEAGFAEADVVIERRVINHRTAGGAIEPRGVLADWRSDSLTLWSATQVPHFLRLFLALLLGMTEERVRVIAPEVGGGFGSKLQVYGEEVLLAWCSRKLNRPVKWIETRSEAMMVTHHGRDQIAHVKMGAKRDGTITAWHVRILADMGAYNMLLTPLIPSLGAFVMGGCYRIPNIRTDIVGVFTNKCPTDAIRGAGRPEATHMIEVTLDQLAHELDIDRLELRRRNFIPKDAFPFQTASAVIYDSGNYHGTLDLLLEHVDMEAFRREQEVLRADGIYRGIGFSTYTEICGLAPSRVAGPPVVGIQAGFWESGMVRVHNTGAVTVYTGTSPHGQGLETSFAQIVADQLGVDPSVVEVLHGDTGTGPEGRNTYGSRSLATGGEAVLRAAGKVADKARKIVAHQLEAAPEDIEVRDGSFSVRGSPDKGMTLADVAGVAYLGIELPEGLEPGLEETSFYDPENFVFPFGAHACILDVDAETGKVKVVRWVAVDDCGNAVNPMLIDGQVHGGVVHAIGQALYERVHYDEDGQLVTGTFVDYALPTAAELPSFETDRTETPSPVNALGVKGVGEAGTIAGSPAVTNALIDALRPLGVSYINMPLTPMRVWEAISEAKSAANGGVPA
jgi:aerobic carbon-monoxide dehydrogenase large subunit